jgi:phospho-N-acetylmuramoyl-pentapeptide-transferase
MFYLLHEYFSAINLLKYISFRGWGAMFTALLISFLIGGKVINWLKSIQSNGQPIRDDGPESHFKKAGTPTMGGIMILASIVISVLLWADLSNLYVWITLFVTLSFGLLGLLDDYKKLKHNNTKGISGKRKMLWQLLTSLLAAIAISSLAKAEHQTTLAFPFFKNFLLDLSIFYYVFVIVVITGASNAVNLTDGLDGLAIGAVIICTGCFAIFAYLVGNAVFANYLQLHHVADAGELAVICAAVIGSGLGFLWFNASPARVFMGDTGSLSLGGLIGTMSVITKHEIVLAITGGLFVMEALSVMIQVGSYKLTGKRVFKMAPIHHHFEQLGWSETTVVTRFWILAIIFALLGLSTLKLR